MKSVQRVLNLSTRACRSGCKCGFYERKLCRDKYGAGKSEFRSFRQSESQLTTLKSAKFNYRKNCQYVKDVKIVLSALIPQKSKTYTHICHAENVEVAVTVSGINTETKLPMVTELSSSDIFLLVSTTLNTLCDEISKNFSLVEPELCSDIYIRGIALTGGMANIDGISRFISSRLGVDTNIIPNPELAVVKGLDRSINHERIG